MALVSDRQHSGRKRAGLLERIDSYQRRHRWLGFPIAIVRKFVDDQGHHLAALVTYYAFVSLFPLLLLGSSILGFALQNDPERHREILDTALNQFPVVGSQLDTPQELTGSTVAIVVGLLGALYGALGVAQATQNAMNVAWAVPRSVRPNPLLARLRSLLLLALAAVAILTTSLLSTLTYGTAILGVDLSVWSGALVGVLTVGINGVVFALVFWLATTDKHGLRAVVPGAAVAATLLYAMQLLGSTYLDQVVRGSGFTYGTFAVVLGLLGWIYLGAVLMILCAELNVVYERRLHPRALIGRFTQRPDLTDADRRAYIAQANTHRPRDFIRLTVTFDDATHAENSESGQDPGPGLQQRDSL